MAALHLTTAIPCSAGAQEGVNEPDAAGTQQAAGDGADVARAEAVAEQAYQAYHAGDYAQAAELYERALQAAPSADILYNLARIYDTRLRDRRNAIEYYQRYVADTGADPARARTAHERLRVLLELERMAQEPAATQPAPPQRVVSPNPVEAGAARAPAEQRSSAQPNPPWHSRLSGVQVAGLAIGGVGLSGIGVGIGFGVAAMRDADTANGVCDGNACSEQAGVDAANSASDAALVSTIGFVAGGTLLVTGLGMLLLGGNSDASEHARTHFVPLAGRGVFGAAAMGRW